MTQPPADDESRLKALGDLLRDEEPEQSALDRVTEGSLSAADLQALRERAGDQPRLAAALEAYAPLDPDVKQRIGALFTENAAKRRERALRRTRGWMAAGSVAAAAALAWFGVRERAGDALPEYALTARQATSVRSERPTRETALESGATLVTAPGTQLQLWLRPERGGVAAVNARTFLQRDGRCEPWASTTEVGSQGAVRIELQPIAATPPPSAALVIVLAETGALATRAAALACGEAEPDGSFKRWTLPLRAAR